RRLETDAVHHPDTERRAAPVRRGRVVGQGGDGLVAMAMCRPILSGGMPRRLPARYEGVGVMVEVLWVVNVGLGYRVVVLVLDDDDRPAPTQAPEGRDRQEPAARHPRPSTLS